MQNQCCFTDLAEFYEKHTRADASIRPPTVEELHELIVKLSSHFQTTMIIVDGLDEIAKDRADITRVLQSLNCKSPSIKTLFASRPEVDIKYVLENFISLSIAARSSDIRLYVAAEIGKRTRERKLRIQDPMLKEQIMKRLIEDADGM